MCFTIGICFMQVGRVRSRYAKKDWRLLNRFPVDCICYTTRY